MLTELSVRAFLRRLADRDAPGSGSAAALAGAAGTSLLEMTAKLGGAPPDSAAAARLSQLRESLADLVERDAAVLAEALPALAAIGPNGSGAEWNAILLDAAKTPLAIAENCREALELALPMREDAPPHLLCDVKAAALQCHAALQSALLLAELNVSLLRGDEVSAKALTDQAECLQRRASACVGPILR